MKITAIQPDHKIQLPAEWVDELGLRGFAAMERDRDGIVIRPMPTVTWDEVFADKLPVGSHATALDSPEVSRDDYLF